MDSSVPLHLKDDVNRMVDHGAGSSRADGSGFRRSGRERQACLRLGILVQADDLATPRAVDLRVWGLSGW
jgi:hypothetical protein